MQGDGTGRIVTDVVDADVVSIKARFIYGEASGTIIGLGAYDPSSRMAISFSGGAMRAIIGGSLNFVQLGLSISNAGEEHKPRKSTI